MIPLVMMWTASALAAAAPGYATAAARPTGLWLSAELGGGTIGDDVVAGAGVGAGVETAPFALHVEVPLTLRVVDGAPTVSRALPSSCKYLRCEEWSDAGKVSLDAIARVVEELRVLRPGDAVHVRGGRLFATLGRGQHVARYTNAAEWDRRGSGLYVEGNVDGGRMKFEGLAGRLLAPQDLVAARASLSPWAVAGALPARSEKDEEGDEGRSEAGSRFLGRMRLGIESAVDMRAPIGVAVDASGALLPGSESRVIAGAAIDLGWPLLGGSNGAGLQVEPWISASAMNGLLDRSGAAGGTTGFGVGGSGGVDVTADAVFVVLRASGRGTLDGARHRSAVFSTLYDVDRKRALARTGAFSATGIAELAASGGAGGGATLEVVVWRAVRAGARVHVDPVPEASELEVFTDIGVGPVLIGARGVQRALRSPRDALAFGDRTCIVAEGAWSAWPPLSLFARWRHAPRFDGTRLSADDDIFAGVSLDAVLQ